MKEAADAFAARLIQPLQGPSRTAAVSIASAKAPAPRNHLARGKTWVQRASFDTPTFSKKLGEIIARATSTAADKQQVKIKRAASRAL
jgi:hypothetical protein